MVLFELYLITICYQTVLHLKSLFMVFFSLPPSRQILQGWPHFTKTQPYSIPLPRLLFKNIDDIHENTLIFLFRAQTFFPPIYQYNHFHYPVFGHPPMLDTYTSINLIDRASILFLPETLVRKFCQYFCLYWGPYLYPLTQMYKK